MRMTAGAGVYLRVTSACFTAPLPGHGGRTATLGPRAACGTRWEEAPHLGPASLRAGGPTAAYMGPSPVGARGWGFRPLGPRGALSVGIRCVQAGPEAVGSGGPASHPSPSLGAGWRSGRAPRLMAVLAVALIVIGTSIYALGGLVPRPDPLNGFLQSVVLRASEGNLSEHWVDVPGKTVYFLSTDPGATATVVWRYWTASNQLTAVRIEVRLAPGNLLVNDVNITVGPGEYKPIKVTFSGDETWLVLAKVGDFTLTWYVTNGRPAWA